AHIVLKLPVLRRDATNNGRDKFQISSGPFCRECFHWPPHDFAVSYNRFMGKNGLEETAKALVAPGKGILAADESIPTIEKRFKAINFSSTSETRRAYREMLFTT